MDWRRVFTWVWHGFAVLGVLASLLFAVATVLFVGNFGGGEANANQVDKRSVTIEDAQVLMTQAGVVHRGPKRLLGGISPVWNGNANAEAYCIEARIEPGDKGWRRPADEDSFVLDAAEATLALANAQLECIPDPRQLRERQLELKVIALNYGSEGVDTVRVAVRDPLKSQVYLVSAWHPTRVQPAALAPSTE